MQIAKIVSLLGTAAMTGIILYGFIGGDFGREGAQLLSLPWGIVSLVDLYTGFALFSLWIVYREKTWWQALVWVALMLTLGFFTGSLYTFMALQTSGGDWRHFWLGKHA